MADVRLDTYKVEGGSGRSSPVEGTPLKTNKTVNERVSDLSKGFFDRLKENYESFTHISKPVRAIGYALLPITGLALVIYTLFQEIFKDDLDSLEGAMLAAEFINEKFSSENPSLTREELVFFNQVMNLYATSDVFRSNVTEIKTSVGVSILDNKCMQRARDYCDTKIKPRTHHNKTQHSSSKKDLTPPLMKWMATTGSTGRWD